MTAAGNIEWIAPAFEAAWESKAWTENGGRVYGQLLNCLDAQPGADRASHLKTFENYYQRFPCAATAGMYAVATCLLRIRAAWHRGAHEVGEDQYAGMYDHFNQALEILPDHADEGEGNHIWEIGSTRCL